MGGYNKNICLQRIKNTQKRSDNSRKSLVGLEATTAFSDD